TTLSVRDQTFVTWERAFQRPRLSEHAAAGLRAWGIEYFQRAHCGGSTSFHTEPFEYFLDVLLHGGFGDPQNLRYVRIRLSLRQPQQRVRCPGCETELEQRLDR